MQEQDTLLVAYIAVTAPCKLDQLQNIQIDNNFVEVGLVDDYQTTTKRTKVHGSIYSS